MHLLINFTTFLTLKIKQRQVQMHLIMVLVEKTLEYNLKHLLVIYKVFGIFLM